MPFSDVTKNTLIALVSGCVFSLGFEPFGVWPLTILSVTGFFYVLSKATNIRQVFRFSIAYGVGKFGVGVSWIYVSISEFGHAPMLLACLLVVVFVLGLSLLFGLIAMTAVADFSEVTRKTPLLNVVLKCWIFILGWLVYEYLFGMLFGGFPWLLSGYVLLDTPFNGLAPLLGVHGLSLIVLVVATTVRYAWSRRVVLWQLLILIPAWGFHFVEWTAPADEYSIALVQGNAPLEKKWNPVNLDTLMEDSLKLTRSVGEKDFVVWSEGGLPTTVDFVSSRLRRIVEDREIAPLVIGLLDVENDSSQQESETKVFNAVGVFDEEHTAVYRKRKLVPFGEFVPFENWLRGTIEFFDLPMSSFSPGKSSRDPLKVVDLPVAILICYEIVFPDLVAESVVWNKAEMLLVVSEDSWFGASMGPHQHLQIARMRALEHGKYLLRATNSGITAVVAPDGSVVNQLPQFETGVLEANVFAMTGTTPFARSYYVMPFLSLLLLTLLQLFTQNRRRRNMPKRLP